MVKKKEDNTWGTWSMVLGILSIVLFMGPVIGIVSGILAIVFSNKQKKIKMTEQAKIGRITGIIGLVLSILYLIVIIAFLIGLFISTRTVV